MAFFLGMNCLTHDLGRVEVEVPISERVSQRMNIVLWGIFMNGSVWSYLVTQKHTFLQILLGSPGSNGLPMVFGEPFFIQWDRSYSQAGRGFFTYAISKSLGAEQHQGRRTGIFFRWMDQMDAELQKKLTRWSVDILPGCPWNHAMAMMSEVWSDCCIRDVINDIFVGWGFHCLSSTFGNVL